VVEVLSAALDGEHLDRRRRLRAKAAQFGLRAVPSDRIVPAPQVENREVATACGVGSFIDEFLADDRDWDRYTSVGFTPPTGDGTAPAASGSAPVRSTDPDGPSE
jgi:hypothetical protein